MTTNNHPTADDFAKAKFATHPDGYIAARLDKDEDPWRASEGSWLTDDAMAEDGWQIVHPVTSLADVPDAVRAVGYRTDGPIPEGVPYARVTSDGVVAAHPHGSLAGWSEDQMSGWPGDFYLYEPPRREGAAEIEEILSEAGPQLPASILASIADTLAEAGVTIK